jgi:hypothetical protein
MCRVHSLAVQKLNEVVIMVAVRVISAFTRGTAAALLLATIINICFVAAGANSQSGRSSDEWQLAEFEWDIAKDGLEALGAHSGEWRRRPFLVRNVPVLRDCSVYDNVAHFLLHTQPPLGISESDHRLMINHCGDQLWHALYNMSAMTNRVTKNVNQSEFNVETMMDKVNTCDKDSNADSKDAASQAKRGKHYYYGSPMAGPEVLRHLSFSQATNSSSPAWSLWPLSEMLSRDGTLWLASEPGVVTSTHFDYDDNYFLQVAGSKLVTVFEPCNFAWLRPNSILHPRWRQASVLAGDRPQGHASVEDHCTALGSVSTDLQRLCVARFEAAYDTLSNGQGNDGLESHGVHIGVDGSIASVGSACRRTTVNLSAGELLYIPSMYFHSLASGKGSISLSIWKESVQFMEGRDTYVELEVMAPFRYPDPSTRSSDSCVIVSSKISSIENRLQSLAKFVKGLFSQLRVEHGEAMSLGSFIVDLSMRYACVIAATHQKSEDYKNDLREDSWNDALIQCDVMESVFSVASNPAGKSEISLPLLAVGNVDRLHLTGQDELSSTELESVRYFWEKLHRLDDDISVKSLFLLDAVEELYVMAVTGHFRGNALVRSQLVQWNEEASASDYYQASCVQLYLKYLSPCAILDFIKRYLIPCVD